MQKGKRATSAKSSKARLGAAKKTASKKSNTANLRLQAALRKAIDAKKVLQKKLAEKTAELKTKVKQIETDAHEKVHAFLTREHAKREAARKKVIDTALAKFEKIYAVKQAKKTKTARQKARPKAAAAVVRVGSKKRGRPSRK
jgi:colicin import membrane protein